MYTLYYWPIPFRGHVLRFALAEARADWDEAPFEAVADLKARPLAERPLPFMAPPVLHDRQAGTWLAQMPAIAMALGRRHGLLADPDLTLTLLCDANDVLSEITRANGAQMWDRPAWAAFVAGRLPQWMALHDRRMTGGYVCGTAAPTLADLTLAALWHTMVDRLPPLRPLLHATAPRLEALVDRVAARPAIAAVIADWAEDRPRYCGGQIEASIAEMLGLD